MWRCPMPFRSRLPYVAGWMWNFTTALRTLILPLIPIALLAFLPGEIRLRNAILLVPAVVVGHGAIPAVAQLPVDARDLADRPGGRVGAGSRRCGTTPGGRS